MTQDITIMDKAEVRKEYYWSGALRRETPYVNGFKHGVEKAYHDTGVLWYEILYVSGKVY